MKILSSVKQTYYSYPGANTWNDQRHGAIIKKADEFHSSGATVCAICGSTAALEGLGLLDQRPHTSNGPGFLEMVSPGYQGQNFYVDEPSVADDNLLTASSTGGLLWTKQIIERLGVLKQTPWKPGMRILVPANWSISLPSCRLCRLAMETDTSFKEKKRVSVTDTSSAFCIPEWLLPISVFI